MIHTRGAGVKHSKRRAEETKHKKEERDAANLKNLGMASQTDENGNVVLTGAPRPLSRRESRRRSSLMTPKEITHDVNVSDFWRSRNSKTASSSSAESLDLAHMPVESSTKRRGIVFNLKRINSKLALVKEKEKEEEKKRQIEEERLKRKDFNFTTKYKFNC